MIFYFFFRACDYVSMRVSGRRACSAFAQTFLVEMSSELGVKWALRLHQSGGQARDTALRLFGFIIIILVLQLFVSACLPEEACATPVDVFQITTSCWCTSFWWGFSFRCTSSLKEPARFAPVGSAFNPWLPTWWFWKSLWVIEYYSDLSDEPKIIITVNIHTEATMPGFNCMTAV